MNKEGSVKSRLEVNFIRLIDETQHIANGDKPKDWKFDKDRRKLHVLYGSETGTAEEVAERIGRESMKYYFEPSVMPMNDFPIEKLAKEKIVIFVASTTGQGDDPTNMKLFFKSLWQSRQNKLLLKGLNYAVLGLGDSSYQKFNFASKRLNKLLQVLGAKQILSIGLADDQHDLGPDFVIDSWLKKLWEVLMVMYPLCNGLEPIEGLYLSPAKFDVNFLRDSLLTDFQYDQETASVEGKEVYQSRMTINERKTSPDHFQDVRLIEFDVSSINYVHKPGDVLMVQPQNLDCYVEEFIKMMELDGNKLFYLKPKRRETKLPHPLILPQPCTIEQCIKNYLDILSIPKRYFFELLSHFATNELEREKLIEFTTTEGQEELYNYCNRPRRTILEVLADFPHTRCNIPFEYLFDLIPIIRPRAYSIASSSKAISGKAQILMAVVKYRTIIKRPRMGLCSNWLANLNVGSLIPVWIKPGSLDFPEPSSKCPPVVMIGPGTGCAPFRSYIQERVTLSNTENLLMVFGCRNRDKDYFFKDEWEGLSRDGKLKLLCAFSRDQEDKIYIQHVMKENYEMLWKFIGDNQAQIYYAGNAKRIPIDVYEAIQFVCEKSLNLTPIEAEKFMKQNIEKRYQSESWA